MREISGKNRRKLAAVLNYCGVVTLSASLAVSLGFWISQAGVRWLPTMLTIITAACFWALIAMTASQFIGTDAVTQTPKGWKMRKRIKFILTLIVIAGAARLITYGISQPCKLTRLAENGYEEVFADDVSSFNQYDKGLAGSLAQLEKIGAFQHGQTDRTLTADEELALKQLWHEIFSYCYCLDSLSSYHQKWYRFDPSQSQKKYHLRSFMLNYGSELLLYEYGRKICQLVESNENAVKFINALDDGSEITTDSFSHFRNEITNSTQSARISAFIGYYLWLDKLLNASAVADELACGQLWQRIAESTSSVRNMAGISQIGTSLGGDLEIFRREARRSWLPLQKGVALWMGNTRVRRSGTYLIDDKLLDDFTTKLTPGDIMLGRKNWYLSNVGLPGFWPHAILHVGTPAQMQKYFDDEQTRKFLSETYDTDLPLCDYLAKTYPASWQEFATGHAGRPYRVIEAVAPGVVPHTMRQTRGDFLVALRPKLPRYCKAAAIIEAFSHMGKPYDYDFDFATDHAMVCTELVWRCYRQRDQRVGLTIAPIEVGGRLTLPANEIAKAFVNEYEANKADPASACQLEFVAFLDASEKTLKAHDAKLEDFIDSASRSKWSFAQD